MAKSRKKKNYKLRRRVMRTIAALTMVMAVVVAAIPVENYGTMQASGVDGVNLKADAEAFLLSNGAVKDPLYGPNDSGNEGSYKDAVKTAQHIEGDSFIDAYEITLKANSYDAMISKSVFEADIDKFDIYEEEYYDYIKMDSDYIDTLCAAFNQEQYELVYQEKSDATTYPANSVSITVAGSTTPTTLTFDAVTVKSVDMDTNPTGSTSSSPTGSITLSGSNDNSYVDINSTIPDVVKIYREYAPNMLKEHTDKLNKFNADLKVYTDVLDGIVAKGNNVTQQDEKNWNNAKTEIDKLNTQNNPAYRTITKTFGDIRSTESAIDGDKNSLQDLVDYTICQRMSSGSTSLKRYALKRLTTPADATVYVPVNTSGQGPEGGQVNDPEGYLAGGKATIKGIKSDAFNPKTTDHTDDNDGEVGTLSIPPSVTFIGARAFANSNFLKDVTIDDSNCRILGDEAFSGCVHLGSVKFTSGNSKLETIGRMAFYNTSLNSIVFPEYLTKIGAGCLYLSGITEMTMGGLRNGTLEIEPYAFFGCDKLSKVNFAGESTDFKIGRAAFALTADQDGGALVNFAFPSYMNRLQQSNDGDKNDFILAGREGLKTVVLPGRLGNSVSEDTGRKVPDNTFAGCKNLECVEFPKDAYNATYDPNVLFKGVYNDQFYVRGPESGSGSGSVAEPRKCTWNAIPGYLTEDGKSGVVPYVYTGADGKEHMEIGVGEENRDDYIATIDILDANAKTASLSGYTENRPTGNPLAVVVPETVGGYTIVEIADGCFEDVSDIIYKVIISDGTVKKINANAFRGCDKLQWVELGDSVSYIGASAFEGCKSLENVFFSQTQTALFGDEDSYWKDALTIEQNAFKTGSDFLTFHGAVHPEYAPYKLAMSEESKSMTGSSLQICYKTDAPTNLTILRDNATGLSTLIDYPHYEEIDTINKNLIQLWAKGDSGYSITDKFEEWNSLRNTTDPNYAERPYNKYKNFSEEDIPLYTLFMTIPRGIDSIDANAYYNETQNASDLAYLSRSYTPETKLANGKEIEIGIKGESDSLERNINQKRSYSRYGDVRSVYSDDKYIADKDLDEFGQKAGLFSGFLAESELSTDITRITDDIPGIIWRTYNGHSYVENSVIGNDYLTTIDLKTIRSLPDYAFMSCENLLSTAYGPQMQEIGALPYRNCKNLTNISIPAENPYVQFGNMILFRKTQTPANGLEIIQCLEGRGSGSGASGSFKVGVDSGDPLLANVVSIDNEAFSYCEEITEVDLTASSVTQIPERCFYKSGKLGTVKLPESIETIGAEAFLDTSDNMEITIPNPSCAIGETAFNFDGNRKVTIRGPQFDASGTRNSAIYNFYLKMKDKLRPQGKEENIIFVSEDKHKVTFIDYDTSLIVDPEVQNPQYVDHAADAICVARPERSGYEFSAWKCILSDGTQFTGSGDPWLNVTEDRIIQAVYKPNSNIVVPDGNEYTLTIKNGTANGKTEPITAKGGDRILVAAESRTDGSQFTYWTVEPASYANLLVDGVSTASTTFIMPNENVTLTANFSGGSGGNTPGPDGKYTVTVVNGRGGGQFAPGTTVTITANTPNAGASFVNWTTATAGVTLANAKSAVTTFVMPSSNVTVTANFSDGSGGQPGGDSGTKYKVTVNYGSGSGEYAAGATVNISAYAPESSSRVFSKWTTNNSGLGFANANSSTTSFIMPAADVTVTANYKLRSDDDDDDDDDRPSKRPGSNTNTTTVDNRPGSSSTTPGTTGPVTSPSNDSTAGTNNNDGNKIYITKNGVSNKDVASISVDGSTDNFIVRITESAEATAAVEESLRNMYGSLDGLAYFPMDISLYDSTGQNKITDTYGLNITVTMPIPDVLIQYGGNARVAAADNGNLQQLTPRFTTIDGIACISFVPPHFSPYVIYVDTNNLTAGQMLDATPATGDPIHPKWFAAIGMACISILLFVTSDGRKRKNFRAA